MIRSLEQSMIELKNSNLLNAPPAPQSEYPKFALGQYIEPTHEQKVMFLILFFVQFEFYD